MGVFDKLFPKKQSVKVVEGFKLLNGYTPSFRSWNGALYESELVRSAIDARARHVSKLKVQFYGSAKPTLRAKMKHVPNGYQTWSQFMYWLCTILDMQNTAFIVPIFGKGMEVEGITTFLPQKYELVQSMNGTPYIRFYFANNKTVLFRLDEVGIMTKFQYANEYFGEDNTSLNQTMDLINIQNQGISEAVKNGASFRFYGTMTNFATDEDLKKERERFNSGSLQGEGGGILLFPSNYKDIKQVDSKPYTVSGDEREAIQQNVFRYFAVNDAVMQNTAKPDELDAFFNGAIEPFSIQFSEVLTKMLFTQNEQSHGARVIANSNRLQYMTNSEKVQMAQQLGDRGAILIDEVRELFNYPPLPDGKGQHATIRGEYYFVDEEGSNGGDDNASEE